MTQKSTIVTELLNLANHYPSPHNGQPICTKQIDENTFELYFDRQRGLQATDISYIFSFTSMGVFAKHLEYCAAALGHSIEITQKLPEISDIQGDGLVLIAVCKLRWSVNSPNQQAIDAIRARKTSRKKYYVGVTDDVVKKISNIATSAKMKLAQLTPAKASQAIWLNQRAVFDDMFDEPVRVELNNWLRYDQKEKLLKQDGLSYDCMELNGKVLKYIVNHPGILKAPLIRNVIKQYYLKTMKDNSDVFYMMAPFATGSDAYEVGKVIMEVWMELSIRGYYLHPFGTIMSNKQAHADFLELTDENHESEEQSYLVFIFRAGKSEPPVKSLRIPISDHLIQE